MRRLILLLWIVALSAETHCQDKKMDAFIKDLMKKMTVEEKIGQLNLAIKGGSPSDSTVSEINQKKLKAGQVGAICYLYPLSSIKAFQSIAVNQSPNHIPLLFGMDLIHGYKTVFPMPLAMSCSWDMSLIEKSARIAAEEATANGIVWTFAPMVDISHDPRWGRFPEGSGEDPWLGSQIAKAMVKGYQGESLSLNNTLMATVKHFALYGAAGKFDNTVDLSRLTMYNEYLPPYKAAIDAGAGSVMTAFNVVDGIPSSGNHWLLTELLREQWNFNGFVVADYTAINEMTNHGIGDLQTVSAMALKAGTDMDMVGEGFLKTLKKSLDAGKVKMENIDLACRRILEAKYKLGLFDDPFRYINEERAKSDTVTQENLKAAREISTRSMVLLKNDKQILPLRKTGTIVVTGPLADSKADMIGKWAACADINKVTTILDGIKNIGGASVNVQYVPFKVSSGRTRQQNANVSQPDSERLSDEVLQTVKNADVIIVVLGEPTASSSDESRRTDIGLPINQQNFLKSLLATGKPVVLVLVNIHPVMLSWEYKNVSSILEAWTGGTEAGNAVATVLFGDYNPSGKLTFSVPLNTDQIPINYNRIKTGRPMDPNNKVGSKYPDSSGEALFPFGYGLSYTTYSYSDISLSKTQLTGNEKLIASVTLTNTGKYEGEEVVQLYIQDPVATISRPEKELKNFKKVLLTPGEKKEVSFEVTKNDLMFYNSDLKYDWEPGDFIIFIGTNSRNVKSARVTWEK
jgi:beta-glucosidase